MMWKLIKIMIESEFVLRFKEIIIDFWILKILSIRRFKFCLLTGPNGSKDTEEPSHVGLEGYYEDTGIGFYLFTRKYSSYYINILLMVLLTPENCLQDQIFLKQFNSIQFISLKTFYDTQSAIYIIY